MNRCLFFIRRSPPVFAVGFLCLGLANCSEKPKGSSDPQIQSVLQKGDTIIASTSDGIYEASQTEKVWRKQVTPISMQNGGSLVQESAVSPKLVYYTGWGGFGFPTNGKEGCLFVSEDAGKTWTPSSLSQNVMHAFITPDGSIFAATEGIVTTPPPPRGGYLTWTTDKDGVKHYPSVHLLVSRDNGHGWKDITPPLQSGFGLDSIFQDPDHPNRVCVSSSAINHSSRDFFYQASDDTYSSWREIRDDDWSGGHKQLYSLDFLGSIGAGGDVGATLGNFFKFPFPRSGNGPSLPNGNLVCEKAVYSFHLEQPMPVSVRTFFMFPTGREEEWLDNKNEKLFWGLKIQQDETGGFLSDDHPEPYPAAIIVDQLANGLISNPQNVEVGFDIPNRDAKIAAYLHDPDLVTVRVDQTHPYRRVIDIGKLYNFSQPGHYRLQIFHSDDWLIGAAHLRSGNYMASGVIDVSVVP